MKKLDKESDEVSRGSWEKLRTKETYTSILFRITILRDFRQEKMPLDKDVSSRSQTEAFRIISLISKVKHHHYLQK